LTINIVSKYNVKVVNSSPGRGLQLNAGVSVSSYDILIFLHADTFLPGNAFRDIETMFSDPRMLISTFRLKFDNRHPVLTFYSYFSKFDSIFSTFGDQGIVIRKHFLISLGGFKDFKLFEDVDLLRRARKFTSIKKMKSSVVTSARRFLRNGIVRTQILNLWYILNYLATGNTDKIYNKYFK
jgi:hypothetical protein